MAIKKIDSFNKHQNPSTNQNPFDVENYLNVNWDKAQETINNNADELKTAQDNISEIKQEQITQNTDIENIKKSNEEKAKEIASLKTELEQTKTNLENYAIHGKSTGEEIHLTDSSETDCRVDVRGNSKQVVREGKNVYNAGKTIDDYFVTSGAKGNIITQYTAKDYVNCKIDKGVMTVEKYNTSGYNWISKWIEIDKNTDYTISLDKSTTSVSVVGFSTKENNTEGVIIAELINSKKDVNFNSRDYAYYAVSFYPKQGLEIAIQIEKGKQKTTFEQYGASPSLGYPSKIETVKGSVKVTSYNKNLFSEIVNIKEEVTAYSHFVTGKFNLTKGKEYKLICNTNNNQLNCYINESIATNWTEFKCDGTKKNINFIAKNDVYNSVETVLIKSKSAGKYNISEVMIVEKNVTDYSYVQHKEDSVVLPVQEEMLEGDYFDKVNKKEVHGWGKVILDGSQTIEILGTGKTGNYRFAVTINGIKTGEFNVAETINNLISDKLIVGSNNDTYQAKKDNTMHMRVNNKPQVIIYIEKCSKMTVDEFANFLSKNNIELYYKLAEPKKLDLTQEQIQALEKLEKLKTYKNITNITTDSIAILDVDYKKDLETLLNQITKESEV